ncbi:MAG TPA: hypothetical protein VHL52_15055 [Acidimicrobiia bacterium]|nr:hypothetical protein [Acidimicrobiia bacterium]
MTKDVLYAAVGAPVAAAKALNARLESLRNEMESRTDGLSDLAQKKVDEWAIEGRQVMDKVSDGKMVDELTAKVDFDQAREQVHKLRDQLEDMLATWRTSFRPVEEAAAKTARSVAEAAEKAADEIEEATDEAAKAVRANTTATTAKKAPAKRAAAKKTPAKKTPTKTPAKKSAAKSSTANKTTANKDSAKAS